MQLPLHARKLWKWRRRVSCQEIGESAVVRERCCRVCRGKSPLINQCLPFTLANSILEQVRRHNREVSCFRPSCRCYITWITTYVISCPWHKSFALSRVQTDDESFKSHCRADQSHALEMPPSFLQISPCGQTDLLCAWSSVEGTVGWELWHSDQQEQGEGKEPGGESPFCFFQGWLNYYSFFANLQKNAVCCVLSSWLFEKSGQAGRMHHKVVHIVFDPLPFLLILHPLNWPNKMLLFLSQVCFLAKIIGMGSSIKKQDLKMKIWS